MKQVNTQLGGKFIDGKGIEYRVEIKSQSSKEIINFYINSEVGNGELLICSVFTKYLSKAIGVKKAGEIIREVFGDYSIYTDYEDTRKKAQNYDTKLLKDVSNRKIVDSKIGKFVEVLEKQNNDFFHKLVYYEGTILEEIIQNRVGENGNITNSIEVNLEFEGKKVQANKVKGKEYVIREQEDKSNANIIIQSLDYIALKKDITWMNERNYRILNDKEEFLEYLEKMKICKDIVGFDTETSGLRINRFDKSHPQRDNLVGICISIEPKEGVYIPLRQAKFTNLDEDFVLSNLKPLLSNQSYLDGKEITVPLKQDDIHNVENLNSGLLSGNSEAKIVKEKALLNVVTHYGSFDWKVMYTYGWDLNITDDTYILQYLIDVREANAVKKLKVMSEKILGLQMIDLEDFFPSNRGGKRANIKFSLLPYESVRHYGPTDSDVTRELYYELRPKLPSDMKFIYGIEIDLMKRLSRIEYFGIRIDIAKMLEMREIVVVEKEELEKEIYELAGEVFNINSGDQLERIMFDKLKYPSHGTTASGKRATGKDVLNILSGDKDKEGNLLYPLADKVSKYKKKEKLLNSFLDKLLRENVDGYIFPKYNQAGTQSGRISCSNPNLQQTSGAIRELFIPDNDDYYFLVVDYSQVEYRIMAGLADEYDVIDFFKENPEADYHIMMYARMTGIPYEKVTSKQRKQGKTLNFGISYGMSPPSLALKLHGANTADLVLDAEEKIRDYFDSVANIRDYMTVVKDGAQLRGYVKTLFKRRRHISEFMKEAPKRYEIERGQRKAGNTVVQGTAADIMKFAHVRVEHILEKNGLDARPVASIHDELVIQVNKKYNPWQMIDVVRRAMEIDLSKYNFPPLYIGANVGNSWADGKKDNLECPVGLMERKRNEIIDGEHAEGLQDPVSYMANELRLFAIEIIKEEIDKNNITSLEDAVEIPRLMKYVNNYLGLEQGEFVIKGVISGENIVEILNKLDHVEIYGEDYFDEIVELDDDLDESNDEDENAEEKSEIDYGKLQNYYEENKDRLKLETTIVRKAREVYNEKYSVMGYDRKLIVRIEEPTVDMINDLKDYFESVNVEKGYSVMFQLGSQLKVTDYHTTQIDRFRIIEIIEKHIYKGKEVQYK